ncbi:MAG: hypothetical protein AB8C95_08530, partial [Phycisphaeraceae bacterium]
MTSRALLAAGTLSLLAVTQYTHAQGETYICPCVACASAGSATHGDTSAPFRVSSRWSFTATDGSTGQRGDAITLTYGVVADGTAIGGTGV